MAAASGSLWKRGGFVMWMSGCWDCIEIVLLAVSVGCLSLPALLFGKHKAPFVMTPWLSSYC